MSSSRMVGWTAPRTASANLAALNQAGRLTFFGDLAPLTEKRAFDAVLTRACRTEWVVYAKPPFPGPQAVLAYLARYTHCVAISA